MGAFGVGARKQRGWGSAGQAVERVSIAARSAGPRACAGTQLALGILAAIRNNMVGHELFEPTIGHRHSGRHNDGVTTPAEAFYSAATILPIVMGWRGDEFSDDAESLELAAAAALSGRVR